MATNPIERDTRDTGAACIVLVLLSLLIYGIADLGSQPECLCVPEAQDE